MLRRWSLPFEQHQNPYITRELAFDFHYFFMRKFWFSYLAKAFIVFPGGYGTMDEFFELQSIFAARGTGRFLGGRRTRHTRSRCWMTAAAAL